MGRGRRGLEREGEQAGSTRDVERIRVRSLGQGERLGAGEGSVRSAERRAKLEARRVTRAVDRQLEGPRALGKRHPLGLRGEAAEQPVEGLRGEVVSPPR